MRSRDLVLLCSALVLILGTKTLINFVHAAVDGNYNSVPHYRDYFYVGGEYVTSSTRESLMKNQMYVEKLSPVLDHDHVHDLSPKPYPLVLVHGKAMTGSNWLNTPDGRPGWASYFLTRGYTVYLVDHPTRGRSAWLPGDFKMSTYSAEYMSQRFAGSQHYNLWLQSTLHTQWPGSGLRGDPVYDAFYSSTVQFLSDETESQIKTKLAGMALLDRIGPVILVTHSQSGTLGWSLADARPELVKAIIAIEPYGPPFRQAVFADTPARLWGLTDIALTYEPPASAPEEIKTVIIESNRTDRLSCILQKEPARRLPNLRTIPVLIEVGQASYHVLYDHCTVAFLKQAGVEHVELLQLEDVGIMGNGHMQMMEKNNLEIAKVLDKWVEDNVESVTHNHPRNPQPSRVNM